VGGCAATPTKIRSNKTCREKKQLIKHRTDEKTKQAKTTFLEKKSKNFRAGTGYDYKKKKHREESGKPEETKWQTGVQKIFVSREEGHKKEKIQNRARMKRGAWPVGSKKRVAQQQRTGSFLLEKPRESLKHESGEFIMKGGQKTQEGKKKKEKKGKKPRLGGRRSGEGLAPGNSLPHHLPTRREQK